MALGGLCPAFAFLISGFLELYLQPTFPVLPEPGYSQLRIFNGLPCNYTLNIPNQPEFKINSLEMFEDKYFRLRFDKESFDVEFLTDDLRCPGNFKVKLELESDRAISYFMTSFKGNLEVRKFQDDPEKSRYGTSSIRILANGEEPFNRFILRDQSGVHRYDEKLNIKDLKEIPYGLYDLMVNQTIVDRKLLLQMGGVYTILILENGGNYSHQAITIAPSNTVHLLWQLPQYSLLSLAEVLFSITGLEFTFTQAPESMKSVLLGFWHLTVALGNIVTVFIAGTRIFKSQMVEYFMFSGLMFIDMALFAVLAYRYKPVDF
jgi:solute carrier family 15 oligopeptide transporter 1